jgi:hypothetical protein
VPLAAGTNSRLPQGSGVRAVMRHVGAEPQPSTYKNLPTATIHRRQIIPTRINYRSLHFCKLSRLPIYASIYAKRSCAGTPKNSRLPVSVGCSRTSSSPKSTTPTFGVVGNIAGSRLARNFDLKVTRGGGTQNSVRSGNLGAVESQKMGREVGDGRFIVRRMGEPREVLVH